MQLVSICSASHQYWRSERKTTPNLSIKECWAFIRALFWFVVFVSVFCDYSTLFWQKWHSKCQHRLVSSVSGYVTNVAYTSASSSSKLGHTINSIHSSGVSLQRLVSVCRNHLVGSGVSHSFRRCNLCLIFRYPNETSA